MFDFNASPLRDVSTIARVTIADGANAPDRDDLFSKAEELGVMAGQGKSTRPILGVMLAQFASMGLAAPHAHNGNVNQPEKTGKSDAERAFERYEAGEFAGAVHKHNPESAKVMRSKLNAFVKAGWFQHKGETKAGGDKVSYDIMDVLSRAKDVLDGMSDGLPPFDAYTKVCRDQMKCPARSLTDDELRASMAKPTKSAPEMDDYIANVVKSILDVGGKAEGAEYYDTYATLRKAAEVIRAAYDAEKKAKAEASSDDTDKGETGDAPAEGAAEGAAEGPVPVEGIPPVVETAEAPAEAPAKRTRKAKAPE